MRQLYETDDKKCEYDKIKKSSKLPRKDLFIKDF